MRLPDDDEIYEIDQSYLGPPGRFLGVFRYKALAVYALVGPLHFVILRKVGIPLNLLTVGLVLLWLWWLTSTVADLITYERPMRAVVGTGWNELRGRRASTTQLHADGDAFQRMTRPQRSYRRAQRRKQKKAADAATAS